MATETQCSQKIFKVIIKNKKTQIWIPTKLIHKNQFKKERRQETESQQGQGLVLFQDPEKRDLGAADILTETLGIKVK